MKLHYKIFGRQTGLRVSEFSLGTGMFGTQWGYGAEPEEARRIFDAYTEAGETLGGGLLTGKYREGQKGRATDMKRVVHYEDTAQKTAVLDEVLAIAKEANATPSQVAIAWVRAKGLITIIGPRTHAQLDDNLGALAVRLTEDQLRRLDEVSAVPMGFPHEFLASQEMRQRLAGAKLELIDFPTATVA